MKKTTEVKVTSGGSNTTRFWYVNADGELIEAQAKESPFYALAGSVMATTAEASAIISGATLGGTYNINATRQIIVTVYLYLVNA